VAAAGIVWDYGIRLFDPALSPREAIDLPRIPPAP